jgi:uncharacterized membrane protein YkvA (DUF1232 family)
VLRDLLSAAGGLVLIWLVLLVAVWRIKPEESRLRDMLRLLPDVLRLVHRLARDPSLPKGVRVRLWLLLGYLALPIDLVPDLIPVIGYADDAIIMAAVLRSVVRRSGRTAVQHHWPGTPEGLAALERLARLS